MDQRDDDYCAQYQCPTCCRDSNNEQISASCVFISAFLHEAAAPLKIHAKNSHNLSTKTLAFSFSLTYGIKNCATELVQSTHKCSERKTCGDDRDDHFNSQNLVPLGIELKTYEFFGILYLFF